MKIGILTFHSAHNFGALLQSYALRAYLKAKYEDVDIINYAPGALTRRYELFPYYPLRGTPAEWKGALTALAGNMRCLPSFLKRRQKMRRFIAEYLAVTGKELKTAGDLERSAYDCYIMGSDQIWNPDITLGMDRVFYGDFTRPAAAKCIAYAASMGKDRLDDRYAGDFKKYMANFAAVSLRERSAVPFVQAFTGRPVRVACDPVFLITREQWKKVAQAARINQQSKYLLVYYTEYNQGLMAFADRAARKMGLPVFDLNRNPLRHFNRHRHIYGIGPLEFLAYIANAEYVVTNSFHGIAFAVLFHRQFRAFSHTRVGTRITDLLGMLDLSGRLEPSSGGEALPEDFTDWEKTGALIDRFRRNSANFLADSIETGKMRTDQ